MCSSIRQGVDNNNTETKKKRLKCLQMGAQTLINFPHVIMKLPENVAHCVKK